MPPIATDRLQCVSRPERRAARRLTLSGLGAVLVALAWSATPAQATTQTFNSTGAEQTFTVPAGVASIHVVAIGGSGGAGAGGGSNTGGVGGAPAQVSGDLSVTPG